MNHIEFMEKNSSVLEKTARRMDVCPVCGEVKTIGAVVCWGKCYRGKNGLKYTQQDTEQWLLDNIK